MRLPAKRTTQAEKGIQTKACLLEVHAGVDVARTADARAPKGYALAEVHTVLCVGLQPLLFDCVEISGVEQFFKPPHSRVIELIARYTPLRQEAQGAGDSFILGTIHGRAWLDFALKVAGSHSICAELAWGSHGSRVDAVQVPPDHPGLLH